MHRGQLGVTVLGSSNNWRQGHSPGHQRRNKGRGCPASEVNRAGTAATGHKCLCSEAVSKLLSGSCGLQQPGLAVVLVGSRGDSETYVRSKRKACEELGIVSFAADLPEDVSEDELLKVLLSFLTMLAHVSCIAAKMLKSPCRPRYMPFKHAAKGSTASHSCPMCPALHFPVACSLSNGYAWVQHHTRSCQGPLLHLHDAACWLPCGWHWRLMVNITSTPCMHLPDLGLRPVDKVAARSCLGTSPIPVQRQGNVLDAQPASDVIAPSQAGSSRSGLLPKSNPKQPHRSRPCTATSAGHAPHARASAWARRCLAGGAGFQQRPQGARHPGAASPPQAHPGWAHPGRNQHREGHRRVPSGQHRVPGHAGPYPPVCSLHPQGAAWSADQPSAAAWQKCLQSCFGKVWPGRMNSPPAAAWQNCFRWLCKPRPWGSSLWSGGSCMQVVQQLPGCSCFCVALCQQCHCHAELV